MIKVIFTATLKYPPPGSLLKLLRQKAESIDGFISLETKISSVGAARVETTESVWRDEQAVQEWSVDPLHLVAKNRASLYYQSYSIQRVTLDS